MLRHNVTVLLIVFLCGCGGRRVEVSWDPPALDEPRLSYRVAYVSDGDSVVVMTSDLRRVIEFGKNDAIRVRVAAVDSVGNVGEEVEVTEAGDWRQEAGK